MHGKDRDTLIEQPQTALNQPNRAVTMVWNTLIKQSNMFECFRLHNKFNKISAKKIMFWEKKVRNQRFAGNT